MGACSTTLIAVRFLILMAVVGCGRIGFGGDPPNAGSDVTSGLVGWWRFDEGAGITAADSSGLGNVAMLQGGATWGTGQVGGAIDLSASGYLELASMSGFPMTGSFTVTGWSNMSTLTSGAVMSLDPRVSVPWQQSWALTTRGANCSVCSGLAFFVNDTTNNGCCVCGATVMSSTNRWYHMAAVYDASVPAMNVYLDGQLDDSPLGYGSPPAERGYDASNLGNIGEVSASYRFPGLIDDLRIYDRALDAAEIDAIYGATGGQ